MAEQIGNNGNELTITIPSPQEKDWATNIRDNCFNLISTHDHSGSGSGKKLLAKDSIDATSAWLANDTYFLVTDNAGTGTVNVFKVDTSDQIDFGAQVSILNMVQNTYVTGRNAADSANIDIVKVNASDELEFGTTIGVADFQDDGLTISDNADNTKKIKFDGSGITTATTRTVTIPDADFTAVGTTTTQTLTNKTITGNTAANFDNGGATITLPSSTSTLATLALAETLTNKTIDSDNNTITNIVNADIKAAAAIALNKLAAVTASRVLVSDGSGFASASSVTTTTLGYLDATSSVQTQINGKLTNPATTTGDVLYASSGSTVSRLGIGSAGQVLTVSGGVPAWATNTASPVAPVTKSTTATLITSEETVLADASGGAFTITLYASASNSGRKITIKKTDSSTNAVTIDANASETIDGDTTKALSTQYESIDIICDGSNWHVLDRSIPSNSTSYTPTVTGFGTVSNNTAFWKRVGDEIVIKGSFTSGTPTAVSAKLSLPSGVSVDTGDMSGSQRDIVGSFYKGGGSSVGIPSTSTGTWAVTWSTSDSSAFYLSTSSISSAPVFNLTNGSAIATSGDNIAYELRLPVSGWEG